MLDKNPDKNNEEVFHKIRRIIEQNSVNSFLCREPFVKSYFLTKLIEVIEYPIIYLDFDLLYTGYVTSGMISKKENVSLYQSTKKDWNSILNTVLQRSSLEKCLIIIDSLNGLSSYFEGRDSGRLLNAYVVLMGSIARHTKSNLIFFSIARKKEQEGWVLSPTSRHVVETRRITKLQLQKKGSNLTIDVLNEKNSIQSSIRIPNGF